MTQKQVNKSTRPQVHRLMDFEPCKRSWRMGTCGLWICGLVALSACQTDRVTTSDGWQMPPPPKPMPMPPSSLKADRMAFMVGSKPDDTDNNGFPDAIRASVALFSTSHPTALREDGAFVFMLYPQGRSNGSDSKPIAQWRITGDALKNTQAMAQYGPCYLFTLSLLDPSARGDNGEKKSETGSGDQLPLDRADMICRFEPNDGSPAVLSSGVRTIQIGARMPLAAAP